MQILLLIDQAVTNFILYDIPHPALLIPIMQFLSFMRIYLYIWLIGILILFYIGAYKNHKFIFLWSVSLLTIFLISNFIIKNMVKRDRPLSQYTEKSKNIINENLISVLLPHKKLLIEPYPNVNVSYPSDYSFPSVHTAIAFSTAFVFSYFYKKKFIYFYILASLIAFSRIYLGYHFFLDIVGGIIIGILISKLIFKLFNK